MEHTFQLVITRVYEDGNEELLEDEEESKCPFIVLPDIARASFRDCVPFATLINVFSAGIRAFCGSSYTSTPKGRWCYRAILFC